MEIVARFWGNEKEDRRDSHDDRDECTERR